MVIDLENKTTSILKQELCKRVSTYQKYADDVYTEYKSIDNKDVAILFGWSFMQEFFYIDLIFVDDEYRKKRLATILIKELIKAMNQKNYKAIYCLVISYNNEYMLENILLKENFVKLDEYMNQRLYVLDLKE